MSYDNENATEALAITAASAALAVSGAAKGAKLQVMTMRPCVQAVLLHHPPQRLTCPDTFVQTFLRRGWWRACG